MKEQKNICQSKNARATLSNVLGQRETVLYHEEQYSKYISYITIVTKNVLFATSNFAFTIPHIFLKVQCKFKWTLQIKVQIFTWIPTTLNVLTKTWNDPKPAETSQNDPKPVKMAQILLEFPACFAFQISSPNAQIWAF